ncbi:MAG: GGDEF domain-containing protein [Gammaproteobacteria bacterium]|nr:GGDEF domain-containing protein [Gammaproteobacteria bacterium]
MTAEQLRDASAELNPESAHKPMQQFLMAGVLYLLWIGLAWLSQGLGQLTLDPSSTAFMLTGIAATLGLFFGIARAEPVHQPPAAVVAGTQCLLGLVWATLFTYYVAESSELALGMYITANLFALFQVSRRTFLRLVMIGALAYAAVVCMREIPPASRGTLGADVLQLVIYLGVMGWLALFAGHIHDLRQQLHERNAQLRENIRKVARVAERDHLTKSFNRHYIMETLSREKGRADRSNNGFSICIFDLDHFKALNDEYGHLIGDRILKGFAKRVRAELRAMDAINPSDYRRSFGRFGGEEFIAILPNTGSAGAERCAERIRQAISNRPFDDIYRVTVSVGVASYRRGETVPELLTRADEALYRAKAEGRNRVVTADATEQFDATILDLRDVRG